MSCLQSACDRGFPRALGTISNKYFHAALCHSHFISTIKQVLLHGFFPHKVAAFKIDAGSEQFVLL